MIGQVVFFPVEICRGSPAFAGVRWSMTIVTCISPNSVSGPDDQVLLPSLLLDLVEPLGSGGLDLEGGFTLVIGGGRPEGRSEGGESAKDGRSFAGLGRVGLSLDGDCDSAVTNTVDRGPTMKYLDQLN